MHVDHENHGSGLGTLERHIEANMNFHVIRSLKIAAPYGPRGGATNHAI